MKKLFKSKIFWGVVVVLIVVIILIVRSINSGTKQTYVTEEAKIGNIVQTVSATGQIKSASEIELNFKNTGQLAVLNVKKGDEVKSGQVLAQLKSTNSSISITSAQADLLEARANLDKAIAGVTQEEIDVAKAAVDTAKTDLANAEKTYSQAIENAKQDALTNVNLALTKSRIALQQVNDTIIYKGDPANFNTSNPSLEIKVENGYQAGLIAINAANTSYQSAQASLSDVAVDQAISDGLLAIDKTETNLDDLGDLLDYVITDSTITQTVLDTMKTSINTQRTTIDSSLSTVQTYKQNLADAKITYQTKVSAAQKNLESAEASLALKQAPSRPEDIALYQARVKRAQANLSLAQDQYNDTILRAPIDGIITETNFSVGEQTNLSKPVIKMLANQNYEIEVDIPESDIAKLIVGDSASITLDAFTEDDIFAGTVTTINPAQTDIQDVVYYKVTVIFSPDQSEAIMNLMDKIKPGMTANVDIKTAEKDDVLIIPLRAVKEDGGIKTVSVLAADNQVKDFTVETGLRGDEGLVEITNGLKAGDQVITYTKNQ
ncbi:MAG: efflux RND transporter periplasmic adaptor subunit [Candidatus Buchananbacteria bacterium]|nr:efflux RND transporter periplasmic adaptor subunit [Candidatus Buchananbacteria bacterium]